MFLDKFLESGSFGIVHEGKWRDQTVAIKTMKLKGNHSDSTDESNTSNQTIKFEKEASLTYSLMHGNIVKVYGAYLKFLSLSIIG